ncbi:MAG: DUF1638 domain-containing protein, partial [Fusobacteriota bacterium]
MKPIVISCGIFKKEIEHIIKSEDLEADFIFQDSKLHMEPGELERRIREKSDKYKNRKKILLYGACSPDIDKLSKERGFKKVNGINCIEIFLGNKRYKDLHNRENAFFILPEWLKRWKELFKTQLKSKGNLAKHSMRDFNDKIIYIDTGVYPGLKNEIEKFANYCELPYEIIKIDLEEFKKAVKNLIKDS